MGMFVSVDELIQEVQEKSYSVKSGRDGEWDFGMSNEDIIETIESCKQYEFEEPCTAGWIKVANNIEMERVTRVGIRLKCSKCGKVVFATKNKVGYEIDNYCSYCGSYCGMSEKVGG